MAVGSGGVLVELYQDVAVRLAAVSEAEAREMIGATRAGTLLDGWRGGARGDIGEAARAAAALSPLIARAGPIVAEAEINPLAVLAEGSGALALDCLILGQPGSPAA